MNKPSPDRTTQTWSEVVWMTWRLRETPFDLQSASASVSAPSVEHEKKPTCASCTFRCSEKWRIQIKMKLTSCSFYLRVNVLPKCHETQLNVCLPAATSSELDVWDRKQHHNYSNSLSDTYQLFFNLWPWKVTELHPLTISPFPFLCVCQQTSCCCCFLSEVHSLLTLVSAPAGKVRPGPTQMTDEQTEV